ncbi:MAG TPA: DMT family transporter [Solirubrobacteraceae bacterium]|jgi:drug/metabolite transporter (DMT)-like permease
MAALLALISAVLFALAATLQQLGQFVLARKGEAVKGVVQLFKLVLVPAWLLGTLILLVGYATQGAAIDRGKLVVVQPLLVTTIVWALPLGYLLTNQQVTRRQVLGAFVVVVGLALFVLVGDPDAGVDDTSTRNFVVASLVICAIVVVLLLWVRRQRAPALRAAVLGGCSGLLFGLSATFDKPVINDLHVSLGDAATDLATWALLGFGFAAFLIQQLSLGTGQLAPAMAAVSVANPGVSVVLGILLYEERLTRPAWHVLVAVTALLAALAGATIITLANRETEMPGEPGEVAADDRARPEPAPA